MQLFDSIERADRSPRRYDEDSFSFYNRVCGPYWDRIRVQLDSWFSNYPLEDQADLRGHFRSKIAGQHLAATWELYLHHLFSRMGYGIEVHPHLDGSRSRPDFLLTRGSERLYLEAAVVFSGIADSDRDGHREAWVMEAVNEASHPNFHVLIVDFARLPPRKPKARLIYEPVLAWLDTLDPDQVARASQISGELPERLVESKDWAVRYQAMPIRANLGASRGGCSAAVRSPAGTWTTSSS